MKVRCTNCGWVFKVEEVEIRGWVRMPVEGTFGRDVDEEAEYEQLVLDCVACPECGEDEALIPDLEVPPTTAVGGVVVGYDMEAAMQEFVRRIDRGDVKLFKIEEGRQIHEG